MKKKENRLTYCQEEEQKEGNQKVELGDFEWVRQIGSGSTSKVYLVKEKGTGKEYAMKAISKDLM